MIMKFLGAIQEISYDGKLIVRGAFPPRPRDGVVDNRKKKLGQVKRVFGPVDSPYVLIEPTGNSTLLTSIGKQVYIEEAEDYAKGKRRDRRDRALP